VQREIAPLEIVDGGGAAGTCLAIGEHVGHLAGWGITSVAGEGRVIIAPTVQNGGWTAAAAPRAVQ
jgi:hypothetical protein